VISNDGGLLSEPVEVTEITLTPAERVDLIIDFANYEVGQEIVLMNSAPAPYPGDPGVGVLPDVMKFVVTDEEGDTDPLPSELRPVVPIPESEARLEREFELRRADEACAGSEWLINGLHWDDITERLRLGDTEVWSFINRSGIVHPMHMHLVFFQVLDRQDFEIIDDEVVPIGSRIPPLPEESGWKDTVRADPRQITRVIARFEDYTGLFPYHCHILEHEDHEMMRQFEARPACPGDVDRNDVVDTADLVAILAAWGPCPDCPEDTNDDGVVDTEDLIALLAGWGPCP
jgi:spore coat protein A